MDAPPPGDVQPPARNPDDVPVPGLAIPPPSPWWGLGLLVFGYLLQYLGHRAEGNDMGEWAAIKRRAHRPKQQAVLPGDKR